MKKLYVLILFGILTYCTYAQDSAYVRNIIETLSTEKMFGRGASYKGDSIAADFLAKEMQRLGVLPLQVNYLQHYSYNCYSLEGDISLKINDVELEPFTQYRVYPSSRYARPANLEKASWKKQLKDGTWVIGVGKLDTYGPIVGDYETNPVCIEVLESVLPKKVKKISANIPLKYCENYRSQNVVGYVPGVIDSMIVFTAHYDHCGTMGDEIYFPGAHDNASGTAAVLDLAKMTANKKPYYTYVFMLFSGEESGLKGSRYAAENPVVDLSKVILLCNIDMFCGGDEGMMVFNAKSDATKPFFEKLSNLNNESHAALEIIPRDNSANSDHYWFSNYCPSIFILTKGHPYGGYHEPSDKCKSCGLGHYNDFISLICRMTKILDD